MDRRIFGIETEFGVTYSAPGSRPLSPEEVARYLFRKVVSWGRSSNVFLPNGSRLYLDVGSHPEYATAECDSIAQLIAHDRGGEAILHDLVQEAQTRLESEGYDGKIFLFKNNVDSAGNSYGSHENYLITRKGEFGRLADILIPFLVTRQLIAGAGRVLPAQQGGRFAFSQRADHIWEGVSSATTRSRPIINTRDEPHADAEFYRRLHVIVGDSNMSETTTMLKVGTVDLILRMVEAGTIMTDMRLENPIRVTTSKRCQLSSSQRGRTMSWSRKSWTCGNAPLMPSNQATIQALIPRLIGPSKPSCCIPTPRATNLSCPHPKWPNLTCATMTFPPNAVCSICWSGVARRAR